MKRVHLLPALLLVLASTFAPLAAPAQTTDPVADPASAYEAPTADSVLGVFAAVGCGFFGRATIATGGTQVGTWVGVVACCGFAIIDALIDHK
ncbi:MAG: hypothetical protein HZC42_04085 [Candidatus Eisenbacteria bacterium]|nr:hypothetical protein [Candidatus Eisenbacteria bacterium]